VKFAAPVILLYRLFQNRSDMDVGNVHSYLTKWVCM